MIQIKKKWLTTVGGIKVERITRTPSGIPIRRSGIPISVKQEENGVLHTTEGHWAGSLNVFTKTGTPTFMLGWEVIKDNNERAGGKLRVAQFMPIGEMALTLENDSGGTETNREAVVQIELIAFCKFTPWQADEPVMKVLADLFRQLHGACGIPLQRAGNGSRSIRLWDGKAGWFGHGEVPENMHTDPRDFMWNKLFGMAGTKKDVWQIRSGGATLRQIAAGEVEDRTAYDRLMAWAHGEGEARCRAAEKENGNFSVRRVTIPG